MNIITKKYTHTVGLDIDIDLISEKSYNIYIVYYVNCLVNANYIDWVKNQLTSIKHMKGKVYVVATLRKDQEDGFCEQLSIICPDAELEFYYKEEFEYRGIMKVWQLGQIHKSREDIILYFHSKGVTHNKDYSNNRTDLYNVILRNLDKIKEIYTLFPSIDKVGYSSGGIGWIWYNFWYARGSYINMCEKPIITQRRHYYEDWLGRKLEIPDIEYSEIERPFSFYKNTLHSCYGFYTNTNNPNIGTYYCPGKNRYLYFK